MKQIYTTTLRLNLADEDDRRAFDYLQRMDKKQYRSYSRAIVAAVNDHFERQERLAADPYLETREKEDAFLRRACELPQPRCSRLPSLHRSRMTRNFRRHWTLRIASDITFAPAWYYCNARQGHFYYHKDFATDTDVIVIPKGRIFSICLLSNKAYFTTTGGFIYDPR